jgi:hypothetical protein
MITISLSGHNCPFGLVVPAFVRTVIVVKPLHPVLPSAQVLT